MWKTPLGVRTIKGAEARLLKWHLGYAVDSLREEIDYPDLPFESTVGPFDRLTIGQRLYTLNQVARALFLDDVAAPELTCVMEAAFGVITTQVDIWLGEEMSEDFEPVGEHPTTTEMIQAAYREVFAGETATDAIDDEEDGDGADETIVMLGTLLEFAWHFDNDWQDDFDTLDADPEVAKEVRRKLGIPKDYYTAIAHDPSEEELKAAVESLSSLC